MGSFSYNNDHPELPTVRLCADTVRDASVNQEQGPTRHHVYRARTEDVQLQSCEQ